jgi:hypothetical protein
MFGILGEVGQMYDKAFKGSVNSIGNRVVFEVGKFAVEMPVLMGIDYVYYQLSPGEKEKYNFTERLIDNISVYMAVRVAMVSSQKLTGAEEGFPYQKKDAIKKLSETIQKELKGLEEREITPQQYAKLRNEVIKLCQLRANMLNEMAGNKNFAADAKMLKKAATNFEQLAADLKAEIVTNLNIRPAPNMLGVKYFDGSPKELERHLTGKNKGSTLKPSPNDKNTWILTDKNGKTETYINTSPEHAGGENIRMLVESERFNWADTKKKFGSDGSAEQNRLLKEAWDEGWRPLPENKYQEVYNKYKDRLEGIKHRNLQASLSSLSRSIVVNSITIPDLKAAIDNRGPHVLSIEGPMQTMPDGTQGFGGCHTENALKEYCDAHPGATYTIDVTAGDKQNGAYRGKPKITMADGTTYIKINNQGESSFFPDSWSNQRVKDEVEHAVRNDQGRAPGGSWNEYYGFSFDGTVEIHFYLYPDGNFGSYFTKVR